MATILKFSIFNTNCNHNINIGHCHKFGKNTLILRVKNSFEKNKWLKVYIPKPTIQNR